MTSARAAPLPFTQCNDFWRISFRGLRRGYGSRAAGTRGRAGHLSAQVTNRSLTRGQAVTALETNLAAGSPGCSPVPSQVPGEMHPAHENSTAYSPIRFRS